MVLLGEQFKMSRAKVGHVQCVWACAANPGLGYQNKTPLLANSSVSPATGKMTGKLARQISNQLVATLI